KPLAATALGSAPASSRRRKRSRSRAVTAASTSGTGSGGRSTPEASRRRNQLRSPGVLYPFFGILISSDDRRRRDDLQLCVGDQQRAAAPPRRVVKTLPVVRWGGAGNGKRTTDNGQREPSRRLGLEGRVGVLDHPRRRETGLPAVGVVGVVHLRNDVGGLVDRQRRDEQR